MPENTIWYFAYGSNLLRRQAEKRTGKAGESARATLKGFKLTFAKSSDSAPGGVADIIETGNPSDSVKGAIYSLSPEQLDKMDSYEAIREGRYRRREVIAESNGRQLEAVAYEIVEKRGFTKPIPEYLNKILTGLSEHGYPEQVIEEVRKIAEP